MVIQATTVRPQRFRIHIARPASTLLRKAESKMLRARNGRDAALEIRVPVLLITTRCVRRKRRIRLFTRASRKQYAGLRPGGQLPVRVVM